MLQFPQRSMKSKTKLFQCNRQAHTFTHTCQSSWRAVILPEAKVTAVRGASAGVTEADAEPRRCAITKDTADVYRFWTFGLSSPASSVHSQLTAGHGKQNVCATTEQDGI